MQAALDQRYFRVRVVTPQGSATVRTVAGVDRSVVQATTDISIYPNGSTVETAMCGVGEPTLVCGPPGYGRRLWTVAQVGSYERGYYDGVLIPVEGVLDHLLDFGLQGMSDRRADDGC